MTFEPQKHLISLKGKDYLEVKYRLIWFKEDHPNGCIDTEIVLSEPFLLVKATIYGEGGAKLATGHGSAVAKQGAVWAGREAEKAETAAIGRALAHAGYGTQFAGEDEGEYLADSPVERKSAPKQQLSRSTPASLPASGQATASGEPLSMPPPTPWNTTEGWKKFTAAMMTRYEASVEEVEKALTAHDQAYAQGTPLDDWRISVTRATAAVVAYVTMGSPAHIRKVVNEQKDYSAEQRTALIDLAEIIAQATGVTVS